jgi:putative ABC transport system permease protein
MRHLGMLGFIYTRFVSRWALNLLGMASIATMIAITLCVPLFSEGVSRQIMQQELAVQAQRAERPLFSVRYYAMPTRSSPLSLDDAIYIRTWLADALRDRTGIPVLQYYAQYESTPMYRRELVPSAQGPVMSAPLSMRVTCVEGIEQQTRVVEGSPFGQATEDVLHVWLTRAEAERLAVEVGDTFEAHLSLLAGAARLPMRVAGYWEALDPQGSYWYAEPAALLRETCITSEAQFRRYVAPAMPEGTAYAFWFYVLDDTRMNLDGVDRYVRGLQFIEQTLAQRAAGSKMDYAPLAELQRAQERKRILNVTLLSFALPLFGALIVFTAAVAHIVAESQRPETAILASRGTARWQFLLLHTADALLLLAGAVAVGIPLGQGLARLLGYAAGFLQVDLLRGPLEVHLASADWRLTGLGIAVGFVARLVPAWAHSHLTIVQQERWQARPMAALSAARWVALLALAAGAGYAYYRLRLVGWHTADSFWSEPLPRLAPTLLLNLAALLCAELLSLLILPLGFLARFFRSISLYLGLVTVAREGRRHYVPVYLITLCLSMGVFYATLAASADQWLTERLQYSVGSDLTFRHAVEEQAGGVLAAGAEAVWTLPLSAYEALPGVDRAAVVGDYRATTTVNQRPVRLRVLAVERVSFAQVAHWRSDYAHVSLGELMNRLAATPHGIILPARVLSTWPLAEGDTIEVAISLGESGTQTLTCQIVGMYNYFPTSYPDAEPLALINLDYLAQHTGGEFAPTVWLRLRADAETRRLLDAAEGLGILPNAPRDLAHLLRQDTERMERVGGFGMLSVAFVIGLLTATLAFLSSTHAALSARAYLLSVLGAIGLGRGQRNLVVTIENLVVLAFCFMMGTLVGDTAAWFLVPHMPMAIDTAVPVPPFLPVYDWGGMIWLAGGAVLAMALAQAALIWRLMRLPIFEALRLGNRG